MKPPIENDEAPDAAILARFAVAGPALVERTALASVWKVARHDGRPAALKVYHGDDMRNEAAGFELLQALDGAGAARIYDLAGNAALLEWLDGPSLGDLTRRGRDDEACVRLAAVARQIHAAAAKLGDTAPDLDAWLGTLFRLRFADDCPGDARADLRRCQAMARILLAEDAEAAALHGDLHHDNVRVGPRGDCAFDAKGVVGDKTYELANAFRNPKGAPEIVRDPARIRFLADVAAKELGLDRRRLLRWAAVKCALSIAWRAKGVVSVDPEYDLLGVLLGVADPA